MIMMDTHIWFHYINDGIEILSDQIQRTLQHSELYGVSIISCWEIAMLVAKDRLRFIIDVQDWITQALKYKKIKLIDLTPEIAILSTRLPGVFHKDPADRIIVASCMKLSVPLVTLDKNIQNWGYIRTIY